MILGLHGVEVPEYMLVETPTSEEPVYMEYCGSWEYGGRSVEMFVERADNPLDCA